MTDQSFYTSDDNGVRSVVDLESALASAVAEEKEATNRITTGNDPVITSQRYPKLLQFLRRRRNNSTNNHNKKRRGFSLSLRRTTTDNYNSQEGALDAKRVQSLKNQTWAVKLLRWLLGLVLVASAVAVSLAVYYQTSSQERKELHARFRSDSHKLLTDIGSNFVLTMGAADAFMFQVVSQAKSVGRSWPFVLIPDWAVQSAKLLSQTESIYMAFYPRITQAQRAEWETFAQNNDQWVEEAMRVQAKNPHYHGPMVDPETTHYTRSPVIWRNEGPEPPDAEGPFLPSWLGSPVIPSEYPPYNWNALAYEAFANGLMYSMETQSVVVTPVANQADPKDAPAVAQAAVTSDWAIPYLDNDEDPKEPFSDIYYPVLENTGEHVVLNEGRINTTSLGAVAFSFYWRHTLKNILPTQSQGLVVVFENACNGRQSFTYRVDGKTPSFLGFGDLHETKFDGDSNLVYASTLANLTNYMRQDQDTDDDGQIGSPVSSYTGLPMSPYFCQYTLTVYPSSNMENKYITKTPVWFSLGAAAIFIFVAALFFVYDGLVQREVMAQQQLLDAKRHFMRFVSHEVRTPLNAVCLGLGVLQDEICRKQQEQKNLQKKHQVDESANNNVDIMETREHAKALLQGSESIIDLQEPKDDNTSMPIPSPLSSITTAIIDPSFVAEDKLLGEWLDLTKEICDSAESSVGVLDDLLNYDKIQMKSFHMEFTMFGVWNLVQDISKEFRLSAQHKNIHFTLDNRLEEECPNCNYGSKLFKPMLMPIDEEAEGEDALTSFKIVGDRIRLTQVLRNLVSNSIKFTAEGGQLKIRTTWIPRRKTKLPKVDKFNLKNGDKVALKRSGIVNIQIIDTGVGMSEEQVKALFQEGVQFHANDLQGGGGSGLGLFISKGMVEQHSGKLKAYSPGVGCGSIFTIQLPVYNPDSSSRTTAANSTASTPNNKQVSCFGLASQRNAESSTDAVATNRFNSTWKSSSSMVTTPLPKRSLRILVVDDVDSNRKLIARMARNRSHRVDEANDGQEALSMVGAAIAAKKPYDTILMDYEMPTLKGPDSVQTLRRAGCSSFIVGVTGNVLAEDVGHFTACGADCVLAKPVNFQKLEELWERNGILGPAD